MSADVATVQSRVSVMSRLLGPYVVLRGNRNLALLFGGQVVSSLGDWLYIIALIVVAYNVTHSATTVAALTFVRLLPYAVFLPIAGALADRWDRKWLMISADLGRALCMVGLLFVSSRATLPLAFPLVFITTSLSSLFRPALSSALPSIVPAEDLVKANGLMTQMDSLSFVVGPVLGGVLVLLGHVQLAFLVNAITFAVSAASLAFIQIPPRNPIASADESGWLSEILAGFRFLFRENEGVLAAYTLSVCSLTVLGGGIWTLLLVLSEKSFHLGAQGAGFLNAAYGAGGLMAGFLVAPVLARVRLGRLFIVAVVISALLNLGVGLSPAGGLPFILLALMGLFDVLSQVAGTTVIQTATPAEVLGRAFGAFESIVLGAMLVGALAVGPLIGLVGPRATMVALALAGLALVAISLPQLLRLDSVLGARMFLRQVPALGGLSRGMIDDLASRLEVEHFPAGTIIVRQGDVGEKLYVVKSGEVDVFAHVESGGCGDAGAEPVKVATLSKPDFFGEVSLLRDVPRTATVRARSDVETYSLSRLDFQSLMRRANELHDALRGTSDARVVDTQTKLLARM